MYFNYDDFAWTFQKPFQGHSNDAKSSGFEPTTFRPGQSLFCQLLTYTVEHFQGASTLGDHGAVTNKLRGWLTHGLCMSRKKVHVWLHLKPCTTWAAKQLRIFKYKDVIISSLTVPKLSKTCSSKALTKSSLKLSRHNFRKILAFSTHAIPSFNLAWNFMQKKNYFKLLA